MTGFGKAGFARYDSRISRRLIIAPLLLIAWLLVAGPSVSSAATVVDQYTEQVPTPGGEKPSSEVKKPTGGNGSGGNGSGGGATSPGDATTPDETGSPADATTPGGGGGSDGESDGAGSQAAGGGSGGGGSGNSANSSSGSGSGPGISATAADSAVAGQAGGMGLLFPLILVAALVAVVATLVVRRSAREPQAR